jgi:large subunit ribosomal protein L22
MEGTAAVKFVRMSPRKVRIVANMVRGKSVNDALGILTLLPKRSAKIIHKLVTSAAANVEDKSKGRADVDSLVIKAIQVDNGPLIKRFMPRAMGRANRIQHRTSHITVILDEAGAQ